jgi:hypothetical protein
METKSKKAKDTTAEVASKEINETAITLLNRLDTIQGNIDDAFNVYVDYVVGETTISDAERRRLLGSGVRRYGFIDKVSDIALVNSEYAPPFMNLPGLKNNLRLIEALRDIATRINQLSRFNSDLLLTYGDEAYRQALSYYNTVREAARSRTPGALEVYRMLQLYFKKMRNGAGEPTEPEVERDVRALLHGKKDGKIVIENETPHIVGGKHVVVDETHKDKATVRETESGVIRE